MSLKVTDLPTPELYHRGSRDWYKFGDGDGAVSVTVGPSSRGTAFCCHTDSSKHDCVHIRALERHLTIRDFRNEKGEEL